MSLPDAVQQLQNTMSWLVKGEVNQLNLLQSEGLISDNCVDWEDVAEIDAQRILDNWKTIKGKLK